MIGIVIVSHSARLAEGLGELAAQAAHGAVKIAAAGGTEDRENPLGADAFRVLRAIESVYSADGVIVFMDLGSAVLSAETALELLDEERRANVHLCPAPLVEGTIEAVSQAAAGAPLTEILQHARAAHGGKAAFSDGAAAQQETGAEALAKVTNRLGLHARPAAELVRRASGARVTLENMARPGGEADAGSISAILGLAARQGHEVRIRARGNGAREAVQALAAFIAGGCGERDLSPEAAPVAARATTPGQLSGIPASAGIASAPLARFHPAGMEAERRTIERPEDERRRLLAALKGAQEETRALAEWSRTHGGGEEAGIFDAQLLFLEDPLVIEGATRMIDEERTNAEFAWQEVMRALRARLAALDDPYLRVRTADVGDVAARVLRRLTGEGGGAPNLAAPSILAAHDLTPSEVQGLNPSMCLGLCLETGSAVAHSVILARSKGIPAVVGIGPAISALPEGTVVALDGELGQVWIAPGPAQVEELARRREQWLAGRRVAVEKRHEPAATRDGRRVRVFANISGVAEAAQAVDCGADGVGVLRTEFLFTGRKDPPGEAEQVAAYRTIAKSMAGRPLTIRALDIGGDKGLSYVEIGEEANPFLGWRGIRVLLGRRDLLRTQLRAVLRAGAGEAIELLLPMITSPAEVREVKAMLRSAEGELEGERLKFAGGMKVGVMIEAPAAAAMADQLAREADFLSIGTNDLIQYMMAADRTNARVAGLADAFQPAVLRAIRQTVEAARAAGIPAALCGEMAADPLATPLLLGLGVEEFSVSAPLIPGLKRAIAQWSLSEAEAIAREAMGLDSRSEVRRMLEAGGRK